MVEIDPSGFDFLGDVENVVLKVGGENAADVPGTVATVKAILETGRRVIPVFSAPRAGAYSPTDQLVALADHVAGGTGPVEGRLRGYQQELEDICGHMQGFMTGSLSALPDAQKARWGQIIRDKIEQRGTAFDGSLEEAARMPAHWASTRFIQHGRDRLYHANNQEAVTFTGLGELASADVYAALFEELGMDARVLNTQALAPQAFFAGPESPQDLARKASLLGDPLAGIRSLWSELDEVSRNTLVCLPGYAPGVAYSKGYSDVLAMICARARTNLETAVVIAKQWPIWSRDPRSGKGQLVPHVNRNFASNLFEDNGGKAAALHPDAVDWLSSEIDVFVTNPSQFDRGVTRITASPLHGRAPRVDTVAVTPVPAAVLVKGGGMADRPGVFSAILSQFGAVSIGHAPSDALTVLVTFHEAAALERLPALRAALSSMGNFEVDPVERHSWIHCLGNHLDGRVKGQAQICLADAKVSGDWSIGSPGGIKFLVPNDSVQIGVNALHDGLIRPY